MSDLYGLIGERLGHSYSPIIHREILKEIKMDGCYHLFEVKREDLKDALYGLKALGAKGVNVTIPYKVEVMKYLDALSGEAEAVGAVNTIAFENGSMVGYNTDYYGFGMLMKGSSIDIKGKRAVVLGSGGAARAVVQYLKDNGAEKVVVVSRSAQNADFNDVELIDYTRLAWLRFMDVIINCTPCGMYPDIDCTPVSREILNNFAAAVDLIYNPGKTLFLKLADEIGIKTVNGMQMLIGQAIKAQEIWNKIRIDLTIINSISKKIR
ncbi:shikimate dehydrogenase [Fonticella tunisiensis]|uniref:Shikimate dehydrogenase (NADP(+)) n=1 Tax=Fonticella tunisiensis TaxID=1096341 RepID=A0A4R7KRG3_9CLOT|nr:shikimate dehydrogenase [Fonticella tunisiensis]TDT61972.1 shikimate dehydrogenase [Fonticella tunisiensis]